MGYIIIFRMVFLAVHICIIREIIKVYMPKKRYDAKSHLDVSFI